MTSDDILNEAERRWQTLVTERPDLGPPVDLQRVLVTRSLELAEETTGATRGLSAAPAELLDRFARAEAPVLDLAVDVDAGRLTPFLFGFCDDFASGGAGAPARRVRAALQGEDIDIGSLLRASLGRQQEAIRTRANHAGIAPDLLWLVAELSVGPIAHRLQHDALVEPSSAPAAVRALAAGWPHGHCPACASWPALAESVGGARHLRCSFCGADWQPPRARCIYCDEAGESFLIAAADRDRASRRLEFCRSCGGYLKQVDAETPAAFALLPVTDLETSDLDIAAVERGYARPSMRAVDGPDVHCPPEAVT